MLYSPLEIREMIWREVFPSQILREVLPGSPKGMGRRRETVWNPNTQVGAIRTSQHTHDEIISLIYPLGTNPFLIVVTHRYRHGNSITFSNGKHNPTTWEFSLNDKGWKDSFFAKRQRPYNLRVEIEAPNSRDPGQAILTFNNVNSLTVMFMVYDICPPALEIILKNGKERGQGSWFKKNGKPRRIKIDDKPSVPTYETVLLPFLRLRNIKQSKIEVLDAQGIGESEREVIQKIAETIQQPVPVDKSRFPFWSWQDGGTGGYSALWAHNNIQEYRNRCERATNKLDDYTACMLRLADFLTWTKLPRSEREWMTRILRREKVEGDLLWTVADDLRVRRLTLEDMASISLL